MTLKELLQTTPWQDIAIALVSAYPNQRKLLEGYQIVFETLKLMEPQKSDLKLHVIYDDSESEEGGNDVYGKKQTSLTNDGDYYSYRGQNGSVSNSHLKPSQHVRLGRLPPYAYLR